MQPLNAKSSDRVFIVGASESGKTTLARILTKHLRRVVWFDPQADRNLPRTYVSLTKVKAYLGSRWGKPLQCTYIPAPNNPTKAFSGLAELLFAYQAPYERGEPQEVLTLVIDEAHRAYPSTSPPADVANATKLVTSGRHWGIAQYWITQRPTKVHPDVRDNAKESYFFRMQTYKGSRDIAAGFPPDVARAYMELPPLHFVHQKLNYYRLGRIVDFKRVEWLT